MKICITYARGRLAQLIRDAADGNDVVLTRNGVAVARLVAIKNRLSEVEPRHFDTGGTGETVTTVGCELK